MTMHAFQTYTVTYDGQQVFCGEDRTHVTTHVRHRDVHFARIAHRGDSSFPSLCSYSCSYRILDGELRLEQGPVTSAIRADVTDVTGVL
jgi:predicted DCC family thiol-disulfide oxidoreductase YuxK